MKFVYSLIGVILALIAFVWTMAPTGKLDPLYCVVENPTEVLIFSLIPHFSSSFTDPNSEAIRDFLANSKDSKNFYSGGKGTASRVTVCPLQRFALQYLSFDILQILIRDHTLKKILDHYKNHKIRLLVYKSQYLNDEALGISPFINSMKYMSNSEFPITFEQSPSYSVVAGSLMTRVDDFIFPMPLNEKQLSGFSFKGSSYSVLSKVQIDADFVSQAAFLPEGLAQVECQADQCKKSFLTDVDSFQKNFKLFDEKHRSISSGDAYSCLQSVSQNLMDLSLGRNLTSTDYPLLLSCARASKDLSTILLTHWALTCPLGNDQKTSFEDLAREHLRTSFINVWLDLSIYKCAKKLDLLGLLKTVELRLKKMGRHRGWDLANLKFDSERITFAPILSDLENDSIFQGRFNLFSPYENIDKRIQKLALLFNSNNPSEALSYFSLTSSRASTQWFLTEYINFHKNLTLEQIKRLFAYVVSTQLTTDGDLNEIIIRFQLSKDWLTLPYLEKKQKITIYFQ